jgi:hypothetical protein
MDPAEPIDRIEPAEPIDRMDPAEPADRGERWLCRMVIILAAAPSGRARPLAARAHRCDERPGSLASRPGWSAPSVNLGQPLPGDGRVDALDPGRLRDASLRRAEQAHAQHTGPDGRVLQDQEVADVTAFARTGDPSAADTLLWPEFNSSGEVMSLNVGGDSQVGTSGQIALDHHCGFWDQIAPRP